MAPLVSLSRLIDRFTEWVGRWVAWLVLAAVLISAVNATVRKVFDTSSNAYLEIQWYLFAAVFLLAAGYTLLRQEHVKIDVISGRFTKRTQIWIDVIGSAFFVLPAGRRGDPPVRCRSSLRALRDAARCRGNAGGLIRWPVFALLPLGFVAARHPGVSELIKRIAFLRGLIADPDAEASDQDARRRSSPNSCSRSRAPNARRPERGQAKP